MELERYKLEIINRKNIKNAPYNPRIIKEENKKELKKFIKKYGILFPGILINKRTMNIISGHQRIAVLDSLLKKDDYEITVSCIDVDKKDEIEINIKLNQSKLQGEFFADKLAEIKIEFPEIDLQKDLAFDKLDLEFMFADDKFESIEGLLPEETKKQMFDLDQLREQKKEYRKQYKEDLKNGITREITNDDYMLTFVFNNNSEKWNILKKQRSILKVIY